MLRVSEALVCSHGVTIYAAISTGTSELKLFNGRTISYKTARGHNPDREPRFHRLEDLGFHIKCIQGHEIRKRHPVKCQFHVIGLYNPYQYFFSTAFFMVSVV
jgi:hypothetical protein